VKRPPGPLTALIVFAAVFLAVLPATPLTARAAEPTGACTPPSERVVDQQSWAQQRMAADQVWPLTRGTGIVGVVDTGVSAAAPALAGAVLPGTNLLGGRGDDDCFGRGTFIAGLIAARPGAGPFAGVAPGMRVFPVRVTDDPPKIIDHAGLARAIASGIRACLDAGARVVAIGLVATLDVQELRDAVAEAARRDVLLVAPASVPRKGQLAFPARLPGVLAVAPLGRSGPLSESLSGPVYGADPALAAPAEDLISIAPRGAGQRSGSGAELAVGYVAGAASLVRAYHPSLSAPQVTARLLASADHPAKPLPDKVIGYGVVNPFASVTKIPATDAPKPPVAEHLGLPVAGQPDRAPAYRALAFAAGVAAIGLLISGPVVMAVAARRRSLR
jgi:membrane-anchored mycosin MYCP